MHEIEIGDWKALFIHLLRILYAFGNDSIQSLNSRCVFTAFSPSSTNLLEIGIDKFHRLAAPPSANLERMLRE